MTDHIFLASSSSVRAQLLQNAGLEVKLVSTQTDEDSVKERLLLAGTPPAELARALAVAKASGAEPPDGWLIAADQVMSYDDRLVSKATTRGEARQILIELSGKTHTLYSAVTIWKDSVERFTHVSTAYLTMREFSPSYIERYLTKNWDEARWCVGCYMLEGEGIRLFQEIKGDYFTILGLPLLPVMTFLINEKAIDG